MNQRTLALLIGRMYRAAAADGGDAGAAAAAAAAAAAGGDKGTQVDAAGARAYLGDFVSDPESLKTMPDADVMKLHGKVAGSTQKHFATLAEKQKATRLEAAKGIKLELPKESKLHQTDAERIATYAREQGLSADEAKAVLAESDRAVAAYDARQQEGAKTQREGWVTEWQADPKLGGDNLPATQKNIQRALDKFVPKGLQEKLTITGFGAYPDMVRFLNNVGAAMREDGGINGGGPGAGGETSAADKLYGDTKTP